MMVSASLLAVLGSGHGGRGSSASDGGTGQVWHEAAALGGAVALDLAAARQARPLTSVDIKRRKQERSKTKLKL